MSQRPAFIRYTRLVHRSWGACEVCGNGRAEFYAIASMERTVPGECVCGNCVSGDEFREDEFLFGHREIAQ